MLEASDRNFGMGDRSPEGLAAEFLARKSAGEKVDPEQYFPLLPGEAAQKEFLELVAGAGSAERSLPRAIASGSLIAGRYRIRESIGSGGMGRVFSAVDEKLGRVVAVKVLAPLAEGNRERKQMFERESRLLADLKHPGIVAVHDAGNDGEFTYIVMDLVEGTAISDVIERARKELERKASGGRLPARDGEHLARAIGREADPGRPELVDAHDWYRSIARILLEIARTLEAAHGKQVVHRDLKPANVMLLGGGAPIVLDFGLAGSPDFSTGGVTEGLYGSVAYLAPEQAKSQKVGMDPRTDVYQLGLILYEMLTLRRAFPGTAIGDILKRIEHGEYSSPRKVDSAVPPDLEAICTMALELASERRYPSAQALREDLERWLEGRAPVASRSARWRSFVRTTRYTARRHPVLAAAAGMLIVGTLTWSLLGREDPGPLTSFFRMVPSVPQGKEYRFVQISERKKEVEVGDLLGFTLRSAGNVEVYALSVFGPEGGDRYVAPWSPTNDKDLDRVRLEKAPKSSWGFHVNQPVEQIVCTELRTDIKPNDYEGLLVLVSPKPVPEIEQWLNTLSAEQGLTGVSFSQAQDLLARTLAPTRGVHMPGSSFSPAQSAGIIKSIAEARKNETHRLGLPDVEEFSIECRVAGK